MPRRLTPLVTGYFYHLIVRSAYSRSIFTKTRYLQFFLGAMRYYTQLTPPVKYSYYRQSPKKYKLTFDKLAVEIVAYCLMPTHVHLLVKQLADNGIRVFLQKTLNAFSHYYNLTTGEKGPVFISPFKAILLTTEEQFIHLSRYIHLNPVTAYLVEDPREYKWSSLSLFLAPKKASPPFNPFPVLSYFKTPRDYLQFVLDQKDYQRQLARIKHLLGESTNYPGSSYL